MSESLGPATLIWARDKRFPDEPPTNAFSPQEQLPDWADPVLETSYNLIKKIIQLPTDKGTISKYFDGLCIVHPEELQRLQDDLWGTSMWGSTYSLSNALNRLQFPVGIHKLIDKNNLELIVPSYRKRNTSST
jgi:hypothetical protein